MCIKTLKKDKFIFFCIQFLFAVSRLPQVVDRSTEFGGGGGWGGSLLRLDLFLFQVWAKDYLFIYKFKR